MPRPVAEASTGLAGEARRSADARLDKFDDGTYKPVAEVNRVVPKVHWEPDAPWDANTRVPPQYAIGQLGGGEAGSANGSANGGGAHGGGVSHGGLVWGGGFEDERERFKLRNSMPPPTDRAKVNGATSATGGEADGAVRIQKASFANHGEPGALRPLSCLAFEPGRAARRRGCWRVRTTAPSFVSARGAAWPPRGGPTTRAS